MDKVGNRTIILSAIEESRRNRRLRKPQTPEKTLPLSQEWERGWREAPGVRAVYSTRKAFVWARAMGPSPRTEFGPLAAPAGTGRVTLALPVLEVRATTATSTQRSSISQRMRTRSFRPKPRSEMFIAVPRAPRLGVILIRGTSSKGCVADLRPAEAVTA